jgi:hypothetical protein
VARKRQKFKVRRSVFADVRLDETSWHDWRIELLLLAELAVREDGVDLAIALFDSIEQHTGLHFDGSMSSWREIADAAPAGLVIVRSENPEFFFGLNNALMSLFHLTVPLPDGSLPDCTPDEMARFRLLAYANEGRAKLSTRIKGLHLLLSARTRSDPDEAANTERLARDTFDTAVGSAAGRLRAIWLAKRRTSRGINVDYVAAFLNVCLETPCSEVEYAPPKRRAWPMKGLTELADRVKTAFEALLENPQPTIPVDQGDVITGNVSRIADLFDRVLTASAVDDGLAAEIFLRSLTDSVIQLRWLLSKNDNTNFTKFKEHSLALERDALERVVRELEAAGMSGEEASALVS